MGKVTLCAMQGGAIMSKGGRKPGSRPGTNAALAALRAQAQAEARTRRQTAAPEFSVLVLVDHVPEQQLARNLTALTAQTWQSDWGSWEAIIIDGSGRIPYTDHPAGDARDSGAHCEAAAQRLQELGVETQLHHLPPDGSQADMGVMINLALECACGRYVCFTEGRDFLALNFLQEACQALQARGAARTDCIRVPAPFLSSEEQEHGPQMLALAQMGLHHIWQYDHRYGAEKVPLLESSHSLSGTLWRRQWLEEQRLRSPENADAIESIERFALAALLATGPEYCAESRGVCFMHERPSRRRIPGNRKLGTRLAQQLAEYFIRHYGELGERYELPRVIQSSTEAKGEYQREGRLWSPLAVADETYACLLRSIPQGGDEDAFMHDMARAVMTMPPGMKSAIDRAMSGRLPEKYRDQSKARHEELQAHCEQMLEAQLRYFSTEGTAQRP